MEARGNTRPSTQRLPEFWENMAKRYPLPFDEKSQDDTSKVIAMVREKGVEISGAEVLDVGCGTGIYTLPLSREAARAVGIDGSFRMVARMMEQIASLRMTNVTAIQGFWQDIDIKAQGFEKAFDIVWAAMTPAIQKPEDFQKMEACSKKWCVFVGWGRKRDNPLMKEVFEKHGLEFGPPPGVTPHIELLRSMGRAPSLEYFDTSWEWTGTLDESVEHLSGFLKVNGATPDRRKLEDSIAPYLQDGVVSDVSRVEEGLLVWQVDR